MDFDLSNLDEDSLRMINYEFSEDVLRLPTIATTQVPSLCCWPHILI